MQFELSFLKLALGSVSQHLEYLFFVFVINKYISICLLMVVINRSLLKANLKGK